MGKRKVEAFYCERCKHVWLPRKNSLSNPKVCPKCKSPYWDCLLYTSPSPRD